MADLYITSDKPEYQIGEVARFTVTLELDDPGTIDVWMKPTLWQLDDTGEPTAPDEYPVYPMHESDDDGDADRMVRGSDLEGAMGNFSG